MAAAAAAAVLRTYRRAGADGATARTRTCPGRQARSARNMQAPAAAQLLVRARLELGRAEVASFRAQDTLVAQPGVLVRWRGLVAERRVRARATGDGGRVVRVHAAAARAAPRAA
jgi:hypothetical protein